MMNRVVSASALLLLLASTTSVHAEQHKNCTIDCLHDTQCVLGEANFTWHPVRPNTGEKFDFSKEVSRDGYHCGCPPGLTGLRCGRKYENCNDGEHVCFNGGGCIDTVEDFYQNDQMYCDCPTHFNDDGDTVRYSGKYCEVEIVSKDSRCTKDHNVCQNGGTCKKTVDEVDPCDCPDGFIGRFCEFFEPSVPKCSLKCMHGGSCRFGTKEEDLSLTVKQPHGKKNESVHVVHQNYMYCECPPGFLGVKCETEETICGDIKCRNGGNCVQIDDEDTGETVHHCDCTEANKKHLAEGIQYTGKHCEIESTSVCHYGDDEKKITFCTHNGTCPEEAHEHCSCSDLFHGAHCETKKPHVATDESKEDTCKLQCKNGGHCRKGSKMDDHVKDLIEQYGSELGHMGLDVAYNKDFEHCACPDGFVGLECEYSMKTCGAGGSEHPCFHGSTCSMVDGMPTCVCTDAATPAAGVYCQHQADNVCTVGDKRSADSDPDPNQGFCVNGGVCVTDKAGKSVCRCHSHWEGPHCEYAKNATETSATVSKSEQEASDSSQQSSGGRTGTAKFGIAVTVLLCLGVAAFGVVKLHNRKYEKEEIPPAYPDMDKNLALDDQSLRAGPVIDMGPERDFDGNELKDVEFI